MTFKKSTKSCFTPAANIFLKSFVGSRLLALSWSRFQHSSVASIDSVEIESGKIVQGHRVRSWVNLLQNFPIFCRSATYSPGKLLEVFPQTQLAIDFVHVSDFLASMSSCVDGILDCIWTLLPCNNWLNFPASGVQLSNAHYRPSISLLLSVVSYLNECNL
jgi:hypothetical protein